MVSPNKCSRWVKEVTNNDERLKDLFGEITQLHPKALLDALRTLQLNTWGSLRVIRERLFRGMCKVGGRLKSVPWDEKTDEERGEEMKKQGISDSRDTPIHKKRPAALRYPDNLSAESRSPHRREVMHEVQKKEKSEESRSPRCPLEAPLALTESRPLSPEEESEEKSEEESSPREVFSHGEESSPREVKFHEEEKPPREVESEENSEESEEKLEESRSPHSPLEVPRALAESRPFSPEEESEEKSEESRSPRVPLQVPRELAESRLQSLEEESKKKRRKKTKRKRRLKRVKKKKSDGRNFENLEEIRSPLAPSEESRALLESRPSTPREETDEKEVGRCAEQKLEERSSNPRTPSIRPLALPESRPSRPPPSPTEESDETTAGTDVGRQKWHEKGRNGAVAKVHAGQKCAQYRAAFSPRTPRPTGLRTPRPTSPRKSRPTNPRTPRLTAPGPVPPRLTAPGFGAPAHHIPGNVPPRLTAPPELVESSKWKRRKRFRFGGGNSRVTV